MRDDHTRLLLQAFPVPEGVRVAGVGYGVESYVPDTEEGVPLSEMGNMGKTTTGAKRRVLSPTHMAAGIFLTDS